MVQSYHVVDHNSFLLCLIYDSSLWNRIRDSFISRYWLQLVPVVSHLRLIILGSYSWLIRATSLTTTHSCCVSNLWSINVGSYTWFTPTTLLAIIDLNCFLLIIDTIPTKYFVFTVAFKFSYFFFSQFGQCDVLIVESTDVIMNFYVHDRWLCHLIVAYIDRRNLHADRR